MRAIVWGFYSNIATLSSTINAVFDYGREDLSWRLPCDVDEPGTSVSDHYICWVCCSEQGNCKYNYNINNYYETEFGLLFNKRKTEAPMGLLGHSMKLHKYPWAHHDAYEAPEVPVVHGT